MTEKYYIGQFFMNSGRTFLVGNTHYESKDKAREVIKSLENTRPNENETFLLFKLEE